METYLVGGAVRDELLGRPVRERDWVVVGATADELKAMGFRQVGRDFPVFLHPDTAEEYALARTERKTGAGHKGFTVHADPAVTLEEDLARRDLTINAMARAADGRLIDPFGGQEDLRAGLLRHVSPAFEEDPLRVFRVARFAAHLPGFRVAPETLGLMSRMAASGSLTELSAERVWQELVRALEGEAPARFVEILRSCEALSPWFEEFRSTDPVPPGRLTDPVQRFAAYVSSLSEEQIEAMTRRLKAPNAYRQLATRVVRHRDTLARWRTVPAERLYQALQECGAFRSDAAFDAVLGVVEALEHQSLDALRETARRLRNEVNAEMFVGQGLSGKALGEALAAARIEALQRAQSSIRSRN